MPRKAIDIAGRVFGRLRVVERSGRSQSGDALWLCVCKCGNSTVVSYSSLNSGNTKSCGCLHKEALIVSNRSRRLNLKGKRFGKLTVLEEVPKRSSDGHVKWRCLCDCGNTSIVSSASLVGRNTRSCGCINVDRLKDNREEHINWKGGVIKYDLSLYKTYCYQLRPYDQVREGPNNELEVKCAYCGRWFSPTRSAVKNRVKGINNLGAENRLYCSQECKKACPIFGQQMYPKGFRITTSREVQPELRQLVFKRDSYMCQKCGRYIPEVQIHCHHITGVVQNPIESADVDNCITLCKECHKDVHRLSGCTYNDLKNICTS